MDLYIAAAVVAVLLAFPVALGAQGAGLQEPGAALHPCGAACPLGFCGLGGQAVRQLVQARLEGCQSHRVRRFLAGAGGGDGGRRLGGS